MLQLFLGSEKTYSGCRTELSGTESSFGADVGYLGQGSRHFDMNYVAVHKGKRTESRMDVSGVLEDGSSKLFRGTIDFQTGSGGSRGDEKEDVLLLGDEVVNQTIPLILCSEEDVEGNHGAAIGRLDEELLFYLCSRGLSEAQASSMVLRARMDALSSRIGDGPTQKLVQDYLQEVTGDGK
ncbi:MAG: SufD family Fe-S cluster assembly protein [Eubacteriales bacterium]|nr:SufD family Fe-S cluster assembly protein [Eubacteriales bacterium]